MSTGIPPNQSVFISDPDFLQPIFSVFHVIINFKSMLILLQYCCWITGINVNQCTTELYAIKGWFTWTNPFTKFSRPIFQLPFANCITWPSNHQSKVGLPVQVTGPQRRMYFSRIQVTWALCPRRCSKQRAATKSAPERGTPIHNVACQAYPALVKIAPVLVPFLFR